MAKTIKKKEKVKAVKPPKIKTDNGMQPMDDTGSNPDKKPPKPPGTP